MGPQGHRARRALPITIPGSSGASWSAMDDGACAAPWPRSAGCALASRQNLARPLRACARSRPRAEAQAQDLFLARRERVEDLVGLLAQGQADDRLDRR